MSLVGRVGCGGYTNATELVPPSSPHLAKYPVWSRDRRGPNQPMQGHLSHPPKEMIDGAQFIGIISSHRFVSGSSPFAPEAIMK